MEARARGAAAGGPAASVAAREAMASLGSDTGGSIRQTGRPVRRSGGMKPTYGLVSRYGLGGPSPPPWTKIGPLTQDVTDCAMLLSAIAGHDSRDSTSLPQPAQDFTQALTGDITGMRIGVPREYFVQGMDPEVENGDSAGNRRAGGAGSLG